MKTSLSFDSTSERCIAAVLSGSGVATRIQAADSNLRVPLSKVTESS